MALRWISDLIGTLRTTLSIKRATLDASGLSADRSYTLPNVSGVFVLDTATQTLENKTLITPEISQINGLISVYGPATGSTSHGNGLEVYVADGGATSGDGGDFLLYAGDTNDGDGGAVRLYGGDSVAGDGAGGNVEIYPGYAVDGGVAGDFIVTAGSASDLDGGAVRLTGGVSSNADGGNIVLTPGLGGNDNGVVQLVGNATISGNLTLTGNLIVNGTTVTVNTDTLAVEDPLIKLGVGNTANSVDGGFYFLYQPSSTPLYAGLFRDASDSGKWKLFELLQSEPTTTVNTGGTGYALGTLVVGALEIGSKTVTLSGNVTIGSSTHTVAFVTSGNTSVTLPTSGTLATTAQIPELLTADRTYYVSPSGSNSNDGLSVGAPFATLAKAYAVAAALNRGIYNVTIQAASGTLTGALDVIGYGPGSGTVTLRGDPTTPANCIISTTSVNAISVRAPCQLIINGFKIQTTTGGSCIFADNNATVIVQNVEMGATANAHFLVYWGSKVDIQTNYTISGGGLRHYSLLNGKVNAAGITINVSTTVTFTEYFAACAYLSMLYWVNTVTGSAVTATKYISDGNSVIFTNGDSPSALPGGTAGSTAHGGEKW